MEQPAPQSQLIPLSDRTLSDLPSFVVQPTYDRGTLRPGMVHIGVGNFHRAHQAWYLHRLMQDGLALDWAILGAGVRPSDALMRERLLKQDCLNTLIELDPSGMATEVIGPMIDFVPVAEDATALIQAMARPDVRIVSLTVTEGGYYLNSAGQFDLGHPDIQHDISNNDVSKTAFGAMVAALRLRRDAGRLPFTALSCDNLKGNGQILRDCVVKLAEAINPGLADWIDDNGSFPNSMVDCIVPATTSSVVNTVRDLGIDDAAPVTHENFRQWVIEDNFCAGRPPWEKVGVTLVDDVHAHEAMKLRILNGGHQLLANAGEILGVDTIADCMADPDISRFHRKVQETDILRHVIPVPEMSAQAYLDQVVSRFRNPAIRDTTRRVAFDGSARHPGFLFLSLRNALSSEASFEGLALAEALWARMCAGVREDGSPIEPNDPKWSMLASAADMARSRPDVWLSLPFYSDFAQHIEFRDAFVHWYTHLWEDGTRATLKAYLDA